MTVTRGTLIPAAAAKLSLLLCIIIFINCSSIAYGLTSSSTIQQQPIRTVAVIGSGIAGLSLAHALENSPSLRGDTDAVPIQVTIYDARSSLNYEAGAGVQLNGGMSVLHKINPTVHRAVADAALPLQKIESRSKPWFPTLDKNNNNNNYDTLLSLTVLDAIQSEGGRVEKELIIDGEVMSYAIMRGALQEALMETLPPSTAARVQFSKSLSGMTGNEKEGGGIVVHFEDGSSDGPFDLVVGCDGVNSAVKEYIETGTIPKGSPGRKSQQALYSGIRIQYAVQQELDATSNVETTLPPVATLRQYFGNGAYALAGMYGSGKHRAPTKCAFTIRLDEDYIGPFRKRSAPQRQKQKLDTGAVTDENADWSQDTRKGTSETMLETIAECGVPDVEVGPIIRQASRFFELGVYFHNPISVKGWSRQVEGSGGRFCTLDGDAAHAMPPFLGQGSNQAIQDSYCLAQQIFAYNNNAALAASGENDTGVTFQAVLKRYEQIRWKPTASISAKAAFLGYLEASTGPTAKFRDLFFRTLGSLGVAKKVYLGAAVPVVNDEKE